MIVSIHLYSALILLYKKISSRLLVILAMEQGDGKSVFSTVILIQTWLKQHFVYVCCLH
jgi:phage/plasmid-associated DNA primase